MKACCIFLLLALVLSVSAQGPEPAQLAHGNVPGEPHHHLKIENDYVRAYFVEVPGHRSTQLHQHDSDYLFVSLGAADAINAVQDKPEVHLTLKDGETHFVRGGFAHVARNLAGAPFRNVTIALLKPQDDAENLCAQVVASAPVGVCNVSPGEDYAREPQFDTSEMRLDLLRLSAKGTYAEKGAKLAFLIVSAGDFGIQMSVKGRPAVKLRQGDMMWFDAGSDVQFRNDSIKQNELLKLTFKDSVPQAAKPDSPSPD